MGATRLPATLIVVRPVITWQSTRVASTQEEMRRQVSKVVKKDVDLFKCQCFNSGGLTYLSPFFCCSQRLLSSLVTFYRRKYLYRIFPRRKHLYRIFSWIRAISRNSRPVTRNLAETLSCNPQPTSSRSDLNSGLRRSGLRHDVIITEAMNYLGCFRHLFILANVTIRYHSIYS